MKDLFSAQADLYAKYRPVYPGSLYEFILGLVKRREIAWDCATGNGQVACVLASHFQHVRATDISDGQLQHAVRQKNIQYSISPAEQTPFDDNIFDLITVAQAYHWFDGTKFCAEATRVGRPGAVVAIWGYDLAYTNSPVDKLVREWNFDILSPYWEKERKHVYTHYDDLPFTFERLDTPEFQIEVRWKREELVGHMRTWSALQRMRTHVGEGPFEQIVARISDAWKSNDTKQFIFPLFLKVGRVKK